MSTFPSGSASDLTVPIVPENTPDTETFGRLDLIEFMSPEMFGGQIWKIEFPSADEIFASRHLTRLDLGAQCPAHASVSAQFLADRLRKKDSGQEIGTSGTVGNKGAPSGHNLTSRLEEI